MPACGILSLLLTLTVFGLCRRFGTERAAFPAAGAVLAVLLLLPFLQKKELPYIYGQYRGAANQARQQHPDMVYLFDPSDDRFWTTFICLHCPENLLSWIPEGCQNKL